MARRRRHGAQSLPAGGVTTWRVKAKTRKRKESVSYAEGSCFAVVHCAAMVRTVFILICVAVVAGCDAEKVSKLEKENQELKAKVEKLENASNLEMQSKCARDAKVWFREEWGSGDRSTITLNHTNHYNKGMNKCFIAIEWHYRVGTGESWNNDISVWDIYENVEYAHFYESHTAFIVKGEGYKSDDRVVTCEAGTSKCKTLDEWNKAVGSYLNN